MDRFWRRRFPSHRIRNAAVGRGGDGPAFEALESRALLTGDFAITQVMTNAEALGNGTTFRPISNALISSGSRVLVDGTFSGPGVVPPSNRAVVLGTTGSLSVVARMGDGIPGVAGSTYLVNGGGANYPQNLTLTGNDVAGFEMAVTGLGGPPRGGVWASPPGGGGGVALHATLNRFLQPIGVSASGNVAYVVDDGSFEVFVNDTVVLAKDDSISIGGVDYLVSNTEVVSATRGINASDQFPLDVLLRPVGNPTQLVEATLLVGPGGVIRGITELNAPAGLGSVGIDSMSSIGVNGAGQVLLSVHLVGDGITSANDEATYLWNGDALTRIIQEGETIPSTGGPFKYQLSSPQFAVGAGGQVLVQVGDGSSSEVKAIALWNSGWQVVAAAGMAVPGGANGEVYSSFGGAAINDSGTVVFGAYTSAPRTGLWASVNGEVSNIVMSGDSITTPAGLRQVSLLDSRGVSSLILGTGEDGQPTFLSNNSKVAFTTTNQGVFIADVSGPPQPGRVSGTVWNDSDHDGAHDAGEVGAAGITVTLLSAAGTTIAGPILTDSTGAYLFTGVTPGDYRVRITAPDAAFSPTGIDAEIGGSGLSDILTVTTGGTIDADAGLIVPGPTATLISGDFDLTSFAVFDGADLPVILHVTFESGIAIDTASLPETVLTLHSTTRLVLMEAVYEAVVDTRAGGKIVTVVYKLVPANDWAEEDLDDYIVRMTTPARDTAGNVGTAGELVGLMSLVDLTPPVMENVRFGVGTDALSEAFAEPVVFSPENVSEFDDMVLTIDFIEAFGLVPNSVVNEASQLTGLVIRPQGGGPVIPAVLSGIHFGSRTISFQMQIDPAARKLYSGEYEVVTGTPEVRDEAGNKTSPGQVLATFAMDFAPPVPTLAPTNGPRPGSVVFDFVLNWHDEASDLTQATRNGLPIILVAPDGTRLVPQRQSATSTNLDSASIRYAIAAPDGKWDENDVGAYRIEIDSQANADTAGNQTEIGDLAGAFVFGYSTSGNLNSGETILLDFLKDGIVKQGLSAVLKTREGKAILYALGDDLVVSEVKNRTRKIEGIVEAIDKIVIDHLVPESYKGSFQVSAPPNARIGVNSIEVNGPLGQFIAPVLDLLGSAKFEGISKIVLGNMQDDHLLEIGEPFNPNEGVTIVLDRVANADIISLSPIKELIVTEWIDDDGDPDLITAPWIGKITVKGDSKRNIAGDFMASIQLSGVGAPKGVTLGAVSIAGDLTGSDWNITGDIGTVVVKDHATNSAIATTTKFKSIAVGDAANFSISAPRDGGTVSFVRWLGGSYSGGSVKSLTGTGEAGIEGDLDIAITLTGHTNSKLAALGPVKLGGDLAGGAWSVTGNTATLAARDFNGAWSAQFTGDVAGVSAGRHMSGNIAARSIKSLAAKGNIDTLNLDLSQTVALKVLALGSLSASRIDHLVLRSVGNVGSITTGALFNSTIYAGVDGDVSGFLTSAEQFSGIASIASIKVNGVPAAPFSVASTNIAAAQIGTISLAFINTDNGDVPFGVAAAAIKLATIKSSVGTIVLRTIEDFESIPPMGDARIQLL